jgi:hypothetical protein
MATMVKSPLFTLRRILHDHRFSQEDIRQPQ